MVYDQQRDAMEQRSVAELVNDLSAQVSRLVRDEMMIAKAELQAKGKRVGVGAGMAGAGGLVALFGLAVLVTAAILALALVLPAWAAALVVGGALLLLAGLLALLGRRQMQKASPPVPRESIESVRKDIAVVKESMRR
ncbi:phage holin family protein [Saccharomonospora sp. NB11]|uniref:phage holin family protein n=1 Tax=Saccharomonospora sp. NB11 TaxID=1642298 RepID=UPI0018D0629B|nr:phage holin family protein [Saccharomonospora sp. NB11]